MPEHATIMRFSDFRRHSSSIQNFQSLIRVGNAHDHQALFCVGRRRAVAILDVDAGIGELVGQPSELARFVAAVDDNNVILDDERSMSFEDVQGLAIIVYYEADDTVVNSIPGRDRVDIDFGFGEGIREASQRAGAVSEEYGELFGKLSK